MIEQITSVPKPLFCAIAGATATGKTELSLKLASHLQCDIVCIDAMQVYRSLDIGTAKPTPEQQALVRHHGIDLASPTEAFNASQFDRAVSPILEEAWNSQTPLVLCGGTGLYYRALLEGFFDVPDNDPDIRERLQHRLQTHGQQAMYAELQRLDREWAETIHPNDARRIVRALEIIELTGMRFSELRAKQKTKPWIEHSIFFALDWPRDLLGERIEKRTRTMYREGLIEETQCMIDMGCTPGHTAMQALGYKECYEYLHHRFTLDEAIAQTVQATKRYAKRQYTWFRNQFRTHWIPVSNGNDFSEIAKQCLQTWSNRDKGIR